MCQSSLGRTVVPVFGRTFSMPFATSTLTPSRRTLRLTPRSAASSASLGKVEPSAKTPLTMLRPTCSTTVEEATALDDVQMRLPLPGSRGVGCRRNAGGIAGDHSLSQPYLTAIDQSSYVCIIADDACASKPGTGHFSRHMKIIRVDSYPASIAYSHVERSSRVKPFWRNRRHRRLTTDSGLVGWGESCSGADTASIEAAVKSMAKFVVGRSIWDVEAIAAEVYGAGLWDYRPMTGKLRLRRHRHGVVGSLRQGGGQPLYRLFGGARRETVDYFYYLSQGLPEEVAAECADGVAKGYGCFYLKVGVNAAAEEGMLEAVRATIGPEGKSASTPTRRGQCRKRCGYSTRWNERFDIDFAEAPVRAIPHSLMLDLQRRVPVALCANEGLGRESDVLAMIESHAADVLCFQLLGRHAAALKPLSHVAALHGQRVIKHRHGEFGIAAAAGQHMMLALPNGPGRAADSLDHGRRHSGGPPADCGRADMGPDRWAWAWHRGR